MKDNQHLKNNSQLSISEQQNQNQALNATLNDLIKKAKHNQFTQEKFYNLELYLLQSTSLSTLFSRLLTDLSEKLELELVELQLVDCNDEIQQLIDDIYGELKFKNLRFRKDEQFLTQLMQNKLEVKLSQQTACINQMFEFSAKKIYSVAILPLVRENRLIGSLHLGSHNKERFTPDLATSFLQHLGSIISICIQNAITQEQFKLLSLVDLLTRTKNRRYFIQSLAREIARSSRSQSPISCLFLDLDHFKRVNDTHGHLTGDRALQAVAQNIMPLLRQSDVLARFGGEEFTIMLPDTDQTDALEIAERIRLEVNRIALQDDQGQTFSISVSIGVSTWKPDSQRLSFEQIQNYLISKADQGVYRAKEKGRNCVQLVD